MELTLILIGLIITLFLLVRQREEISRLRNSLAQTLDQLIRIQSLLEDLKKDSPIVPPPSISPPPLPVAEKISKMSAIPEPETPAIPMLQKKISWFERFKRNNPDIEKFIGENLINKIGIVILVLGISFFVKYAIDKDWINEPARVGIGMLCGAILLGVAHRLRLLYKAFSSVLVAGSVAVFYFTIGIAFHDYGLFNQTTTFVLMIVITLFSVFVSVLYDRQELGVLSFIGGFAVPFIVSTGEGNYHVLFTYLAILNGGMLTISYFKRWFIINFTAFVFTAILFAGWYITEYTYAKPVVLQHAFVYCSVFYVLFSVAFVLNNVVRKNKFAHYEIAALIVNTALYYAVSQHIFHTVLPQYVGLYTLLVGLCNMVFAFIIYRKYQFDRNIIYVLIGLALTLATITIPVQFEGNYITIFWACEAVLLCWLTQKSQLRGFMFASIIVQGLAVISLIMDLLAYAEGSVALRLGLNSTFITGMVTIASLIATYRLLKADRDRYKLAGITFNPATYRRLTLNLALLLGYILPLIEINYQANYFFVNRSAAYVFLYLYHMLYTTALLVFSGEKGVKWMKFIAVFNMLLYIVGAYRIPLMEKEQYIMLLHYIPLACLAYQVWLFGKYRKPFVPWFIAFFIVYACSAEVNIGFLFGTSDWEAYFEMKNFVIKVIFPILWGILSFVFLIFGIRREMKPVRIIALTLLGLTILKLFIYDIRDVSETGKIIAFILLGVLILIISFVYQKIKKLIVDNHEKDVE